MLRNNFLKIVIIMFAFIFGQTAPCFATDTESTLEPTSESESTLEPTLESESTQNITSEPISDPIPDTTSCTQTGFFATDTWDNTTNCFTGNLFLAGNSLQDGSQVGGLSFLAGNIVKTSGNYYYGFTAGNIINISGNYDKDLFIAGNTVVIEPEAQISGDLYIAASSIIISSPAQNIYITGDTLEINTNITGDAVTKVSELKISDNANIGGTLKYASNTTIDGLSDTTQTEVYQSTDNNSASTKATSALYSIFSFTIVLVFLIFCAPNFITKLHLKKSQDKAIDCVTDSLKGLTTLIGIPFLAIILLITIFGLPLAGLLLVIYIAGLILATPVVGYYLGCLLIKDSPKNNKWLDIARGAIGIIAIKILSILPVIGSFCTFIVLIWGLGILWQTIASRKNHISPDHKNKE